MIYTCVLLCAFTVLFANPVKAQQDFTNDEVNEETDGHVVSVKHLIHKRSVPELSIGIKKDGYDRKYILQSTEGFFAGRNTKVWLAKKSGKDFKYYLHQNIVKSLNFTFYHNRKTRSVIAHTVNEKGISEFNGIIDSDKVIRSLNNAKRFRRAASSKSLQNQNHDNNTNNYHILYKRQASKLNTVYPKNNVNNSDNFRHTLNTPRIVYPEILVFVDKSLFLHFNSSIKKTVAYVLIYWSGVDLYFREMEDPLVRLSIAGIVVCKDPIESMDNFIDQSALDRYSTFMSNQKTFNFPQDYDIAVLLVNPEKPQPNDGLAYIGGICRRNMNQITSSAIVRDDGMSFNINVGVQELAHLLGTNYDDNENLNQEQMERCSFKKGFLMSNHRFGENQFYFSSCSKENIKLTLSTEQAMCVQNNPADDKTDDRMLQTFPGQYRTADEQCKFQKYERALVSPRICQHLECDRQGTIDVLWFAALDGTPCDYESVCLMGNCVKVQSVKNNSFSDLRVLFPKDFHPYRSRISLEEQCGKMGVLNVENAVLNGCKLNCEYTSSDGEMIIRKSFNAENGIVCSKSGYCLNGECYYETYQLAEKQCINFGAGTFLSMSEKLCQIVCVRLVYNFPEDFHNASLKRTSEKLIISAPDGITCSDFGFCQNGQCVDTRIMWNDSNPINSTTFLVEISPSKRCEMIGMSLQEIYNEGCMTYCQNETENVDQELVVDDGYPCDNNGICLAGVCDKRNINSKTSNTSHSTTSVDKLHDEFESPSKRCEKNGMALSFYQDVTKCTIQCINMNIRTMLKNKESSVNLNLVADDGYPCGTNAYCLNGKCIVNSFANINTSPSKWTINKLIAPPQGHVSNNIYFHSTNEKEQNIDEDQNNIDIKNFATNLGIDF